MFPSSQNAKKNSIQILKYFVRIVHGLFWIQNLSPQASVGSHL